MARDARKIFRLFKSVNELQQLRDKISKDLIWQPNKTPIIFDILSRLGFFFYWIFDNIQILANIKFINADSSFHLRIASWGWLFGILFGIARNLYDLIELLIKKYPADHIFEKKEKDPKLDFQILKCVVEITGKLGDLITASQGAGIAQKFFGGGKGFTDGAIGLGGLWASLVSLWGIYLK